MAAFKLNTNRTFTARVSITVQDENGKDVTGEFGAEYRVVPIDPDSQLEVDLDKVLVRVFDLDIEGEDGELLTGDALTEAVKYDPAARVALIGTYRAKQTKKNLVKIS